MKIKQVLRSHLPPVFNAFFALALLAGALTFAPHRALAVVTPAATSAVLQGSTTSSVNLVVTGVNFSVFVGSGTTTANSTDRAKFSWKSNNPTAAVINNSTTLTLTFSVNAVGTDVAGNSLTIAADAIQSSDTTHNSLITITSGSITDSAAPQIKNFTYQDGNGNGKIDRFVVNFTEPLSSTSVLRPTDLTLTNVGDFTGAAIGSSTTDTVTLDNTTAAIITFGSEASVVDTAENSGNIAVSSQNGFSLVDMFSNTNAVLGSQSPIPFVDSAAPVYVSSSTLDNNHDGKADYIRVVYSEAINDASVSGSDFQAGISAAGSGNLSTGFTSGSPSSGLFTDIPNDNVIYVAVGNGTDVLAPNTTNYTLHIAQVGNVTDLVGNNYPSFTDKTSADGEQPIVQQFTSITTPSANHTPSEQIVVLEAGTVTYGGACSSPTTSLSPGIVTINFNSLADGTYSNCTITITDTSGNASLPLAISTFVIDSTAPVITAVASAATAGQSQILITWTTNELATSEVNYGLTAGYGISTAISDTPAGVTNHAVILVGLNPCNTYHFSVNSSDPVGNAATSSPDSTFYVSCLGGGLPSGAYNNPVVPTGGFEIILNNGAAKTANPTITITSNAGNDIKSMAVSNTADFSSAIQTAYQPSLQWNICGAAGCANGTHTVYAKFYTTYGRASDVVSSSIDLEQGAGSNAAAAKVTPPSALATLTTHVATTAAVGEFTKPLHKGSSGSQVTILQIFLAQDPTIYPEGQVTGYFGALTMKAVEKFQIKYGISTGGPGFGQVGPATRAKLNALLQTKGK